MDKPAETVLRGIPASDALERYIGEETRKLERVCERIRSCQVVVELRQREQQGAQFAARLIVSLPGTEFVVNREHSDDVYIALRDAFAAAGLQLKQHMRRQGIEARSRNGTPNSRR